VSGKKRSWEEGSHPHSPNPRHYYSLNYVGRSVNYRLEGSSCLTAKEKGGGKLFGAGRGTVNRKTVGFKGRASEKTQGSAEQKTKAAARRRRNINHVLPTEFRPKSSASRAMRPRSAVMSAQYLSFVKGDRTFPGRGAGGPEVQNTRWP